MRSSTGEPHPAGWTGHLAAAGRAPAAPPGLYTPGPPHPGRRGIPPYARAALDAALDGRDAIVSMRGVLTGQLAAGTIQSPPEFTVRMLGEFQRLHSAVDLRLRVAGPEAL